MLTTIGEGRYIGSWELRYDSGGSPFRIWRLPLPRIDDSFLGCAIYLYKTEQSANEGESLGGSGFLVGVRSNVYPDYAYKYAVTCSHVIKEGKAPVVRLTTSKDETRVIPLTDSDWLHHPNGDDVAICPLDLPKDYKVRLLLNDKFITQEIIKKEAIGPGDEVFMVGRLIGHDGKQRNLPSLRFGNISMMADEPIWHPTREIQQESFTIEARSLSGYSGSAVFVYTAPFYPRPGQQMKSSRSITCLLGIDWCHLPIYKPVLESDKETIAYEKRYVEILSGMSGVLPAWKIEELLNLEELVEQRKQEERELETQRSKAAKAAVLDSVDTEAFTKERFIDDLKRVSQQKSDREQS